MLAQDETRLGLKTETGRVITSRGVKPIAPVQWPRDSFWYYGAVEPLTGWTFEQDYDRLNGDCFQAFVNSLSEQLEADELAIVQLDGASAHTSNEIDWPDNIIPICQPAHSPELNPIERLWQHIKARLNGYNFNSLDELRSTLRAIWSSLSREEIASVTGYPFFLEASLSACA